MAVLVVVLVAAFRCDAGCGRSSAEHESLRRAVVVVRLVEVVVPVPKASSSGSTATPVSLAEPRTPPTPPVDSPARMPSVSDVGRLIMSCGTAAVVVTLKARAAWKMSVCMGVQMNGALTDGLADLVGAVQNVRSGSGSTAQGTVTCG
jgi:hypothetical protein